LESYFKDNDVISCFKILSPTEMPSRPVGMASWDVTELEKLCTHFGKNIKILDKEYVAMINVDVVRREFFSFKVQASIEWQEKTFTNLWSMISWNQGCHTGRPKAFWRANRAGRRAALSITPYMNRAGYCRQRNYCSKFTLL
jgi:transposase InsO family protein